MKLKNYVPVVFAAALTLTSPLTAAPQNGATPKGEPVPTIGPDELVRGQKGYGYSVFAGTEPERFEVEVLGVVRNRTPELSYVLARLSGQDLERSGVVGGMSGSPVYFDGKLAGAVAFSYLFELDAIAGITPIAAMRRLGEVAGLDGALVASSGAGGPRTVPAVGFDELVERDFDPALLETYLSSLRPSLAAGLSPAVQWSVGGFGERSRTLLQGALGGDLTLGGALGASSGSGPVGQASELAGAELVPGASVSAVLIDGDLHVAGHGTVTDRTGDDLVAFGHPVFGLGPVRMPMAVSEVVTVIPSRANSFKIANVGPVVGAFDQDREAGVHGRLGLEAPMIPVTVRLSGLAEREYHMRVLDVPRLTPAMVAVAALGALEAASFSTGSQGLDLYARFALAGHDDLEIRQSFDDDQAGMDSILYLLSFGDFLKRNDLAEVEVEEVEVEIHQVMRPRLATLVGAHADRVEAAPGEKVSLHLELQEWRGGRYRQTIETTVPEDLEDGRYVLFVGDGTSMDAVRLAVERRTPETFDQALEMMQSFRPRLELRVFGLVPRPGLAMAGETLPQLPGSVRSILAGGPADALPLTLAIVHQETTVQERPITGVKRIDLRIRRN